MSKEKNTTTKSGGGIVAGLLLLIVGIGLLWYNEGRTVKTQSTINEARKKYTDIKVDKIDDKYEGKLVATKGKLDITEADILTDSEFGISIQAAKLQRVVEMYQWKESCETDDDDKKHCTYEKVWDSHLIDSSDFETVVGHENPTVMAYESQTYIANNVRLGAFTLPEELIAKLSTNKTKNNSQLMEEYKNTIEGITVSGNYLTNVKDNAPEIGNIRITFGYLDSETVSVMAVQTGNTFEAFTSKNGKDVYTIVKGNKTGAQILEDMTKSNNRWKWILRLLGVILTISAFSSMFSFITNLANKVPILGNIVSGATGLISFVLGLSVSLIVIALAWFRFRPLLSIILIVIVVGLFACLKLGVVDKILKKEK